MVRAVDFDGEFAVGPVEVDLEAEQVGVDEGFGEVEAQERIFGAASRARAAAVVEGDGLVEHVEVAAAVGAGHRVAGGGFDVATVVGGLVDDVGQLVGREDVGEIDLGAV